MNFNTRLKLKDKMMKATMIKGIRAIIFSMVVLLAFFWATTPTFAQSFRGPIRGTLTDQSGAVVPEANPGLGGRGPRVVQLGLRLQFLG